MDGFGAVRIAAENRGIPLTSIGPSMGRSKAYVNRLITGGTTPKSSTLATMLAVCDYKLCAIPSEDTTSDMLVIDPIDPALGDVWKKKALSDRRERLLAQQEQVQSELQSIDDQLEQLKHQE